MTHGAGPGGSELARRAIVNVLMSSLTLLTIAVVAVVIVVVVGFVLAHSEATCGIAATGSNC